ncbi:MAG: carbohydrate ABC transporter permease [Bacteroidetes bacterium]|nr:carbohydrate ABC transporter permease [Bacteroidota bacterium]
MTGKPNRLITGVLTILLAITAFLIIFPMLWILFTSLKPESLILGEPARLLPKKITMEQYKLVFQAIPFFTFLKNSIIFSVGVTLFSLFFDSMAGYAFAKLRFRGSNIVFYVVLATLMVPFQIIMIPLYLMMHKLHGLDTYWGLILPRITNAFGIYLMRQFFLSVPEDLLDAGRIEGLNEFKIYVKIALPITTTALTTLGVFHFMYNWNDFLWPLIIINSIERRTLPVGLALFTGEHVMAHGPIMAGAILSILPILIFYLFAQKTFIKGVAISGLKG